MELISMVVAFAALLAIGRMAIMGLDDRRSLMPRAIPVERTGR